MWCLKKIIAWLLAFAILIFSLCFPAFATDPAPTGSRGNFYDWVINSGALDADRPGGPLALAQVVAAAFLKNIMTSGCPLSPPPATIQMVLALVTGT